MKAKQLIANQPILAAVLSAALCLACVPSAFSDDTAAVQKPKTPKAKNDRVYTGRIQHLDPAQRVIIAESFWSTRTFSLGDNCKIALEDKPDATLADLRPGQKIEIQYVAARGVRIAHAVQQKNLVYHGHVEAIDPDAKTIEVKRGGGVREFNLPENYTVLVQGKAGTLADLKVGQRVDVIHESLDNQHLARRIEQNNPAFVGTIRSIDASTRTVKARSFFEERTFRLADNCRIVTGDNSDASLRDLRIGDRVEFTFEDKDGILVANRIGHESPSATAVSSETARAETTVP
jgi:Cu/Ag efflux protein CusF